MDQTLLRISAFHSCHTGKNCEALKYKEIIRVRIEIAALIGQHQVLLLLDVHAVQRLLYEEADPPPADSRDQLFPRDMQHVDRSRIVQTH